MKSTDFLIIGGGAAGTTAAEVIRGLKPEAAITIIDEENHEQYSRVLLPSFVKHKVLREQVFLKKPEWYTDKKIELIKGVRAQKLEPTSKKVTLANGDEILYDKLLLAVGGDVMKLGVAGSNLGNIFYFRTVDDADRIIEASKNASAAVIIGGGFIGLDFATGFTALGIRDITLLIREAYYWQGKLDEASSKVLTSVLIKNGIKVVAGVEVEKLEPKRGETSSVSSVGAVVAKNGVRFEVDIVGVGIGIKTDFAWLAGAGIKIDEGIVTNEYLETNVTDIYAAGDCSEFHDVFFGRQHVMGNWANATSQGVAVAKTMCGVRTVYETISSYSDTFFDGAYSFIGVTDEAYTDKIITRGSVEAGKMARIFVKSINGAMRIVGASIINDPSEVASITTAVKGKKDVSAFVDKLSDSAFDLKELNP